MLRLFYDLCRTGFVLGGVYSLFVGFFVVFFPSLLVEDLEEVFAEDFKLGGLGVSLVKSLGLMMCSDSMVI